jgi:hypothetical protein
MASGTKSKNAGKSGGSKGKNVRAARSAAAVKKPKPWGTIGIIVGLVALAGVVFGYAYVQISAANAWKPSASNEDPSDDIPGVTKIKYEPGQHVTGAQRVAYDHSPPFGGPHDAAWANCTGYVYPNPVRTENMVHTLEHGAVWIAYNPDKIKGGDVDKLSAKVNGQDFMVMSPYPGLDKPISLQSWGHQLKLDSPDDERIDQFIKSLRRNDYTFPEKGATCDTQGGAFDPTNPPPFDATPPPADAVKMDGSGAQTAQTSGGVEVPPATGAPQPPATGGQQPPPSQ